MNKREIAHMILNSFEEKDLIDVISALDRLALKKNGLTEKEVLEIVRSDKDIQDGTYYTHEEVFNKDINDNS
ncbi:hypothetical protein [Halobacillus sp. Cin3]|uniref:hypothetical protein n=1 Tax=Halobacillus sp. Cin3 TaxID=2928441 RepID=UPI00248E9BCA|nr:hypothetical protein [Halobacillus sp. Cin3]